MSVKVAEMKVTDLRELIDELIDERLEELLGDPDSGLELRPEVRARLLQQMESVRLGEYGIPLTELPD